MIRIAAIVVALVVPLLVVIIRCLGNKDTKLTDRRARAEVMSQLLALSEREVQAQTVSPSTNTSLKSPKGPRLAPSDKGGKKPTHPGKTGKLAAAKSQHA
jgi:hypothetical protein